MENKNKIWITTDMHLGHAKMVEYCGRPENHSDLTIENLRKALSVGDTLIDLGDVCIGHDEYWHSLLKTVIPINVKRILLVGNHDKKPRDWYLSHGWDFVCESFSGHYFGRYVTFSHEPIPNIQNLNIHGHLHTHLPRLLRKEWVVPDEEERNKHFLGGLNDNHLLVSTEDLKYKPILLESLISKYDKNKQNPVEKSREVPVGIQ